MLIKELISSQTLIKELIQKINKPGNIIILPNEIDDLATWYDYSDLSTITQSSGSVSQVSDLSGNSNFCFQSNSGRQPTTETATINSLNALEFDGSTQYLEITNNAIFNDPFTIFCVHKLTLPSSLNTTVWSRQSAGASGGVRVLYPNQIAFGTIRSQIFSNTTSNAIQSISGAEDAVYISALTFELEGNSTLYVNDNAPSNGDVTISSFNNLNIPAIIGASGGGALPFYGLIGEFVVFNRVLNSAEISLMQNYLNNKWGAY